LPGHRQISEREDRPGRAAGGAASVGERSIGLGIPDGATRRPCRAPPAPMPIVQVLPASS
jgi:hypothetical protein